MSNQNLISIVDDVKLCPHIALGQANNHWNISLGYCEDGKFGSTVLTDVEFEDFILENETERWNRFVLAAEEGIPTVDMLTYLGRKYGFERIHVIKH